MIIQLPRDTTSIVLRFDGADFDGLDLRQTVTLLSGHEPTPAGVTSTPGRLPRPALGVRRRTMLACGVAGMLIAGVGVSILESPRAEPALYQAHSIAWNDSPPGMQEPIPRSMPYQMPERMRADLDHGPTVVPPDSGPMPAPGLGRPAGTPASNPFGLE